MASLQRALFFALLFSSAFLAAECTNDHRTNKNGGILVTDFTISGTQTIGATNLARITTAFIGSCFDEDSEEFCCLSEDFPTKEALIAWASYLNSEIRKGALETVDDMSGSDVGHLLAG